MRIFQGNNAVYDGDRCIGFRCDECSKVVQSMFGEICKECREKERRHKELLAKIEELRQTVKNGNKHLEGSDLLRLIYDN